MANTLTSLIPDAYAALDVVSRELVGFIPAVARDAKADQVGVGQNLDIAITPANTSGADITPAMSIPSAGDQTIAPVQLTISKSRYTKFSWSGPEQKAVNAGPGFLTVQQDQIAQAIRALINEMEIDLSAAHAANSSRAFGTAATTPFATGADLSDLAQVNKILQDNGAPMSDLHLVLGTAASANLRGKQSQLFRVNEAGTDAMLRRGELGRLMNFALHETGQVNAATAGTGASYVINGAQTVGTTSLPLITGSGTILAGDVVTIGSFKYVVKTGIAAPGTIVLNAPGLVAAASNGATVTVNATSTRNAAFARNSLLLATRTPDVPQGGDLAIDRMVITDPVTGISFELAVYPGFRMNVYFVGISWGVKMLKPEHSAVLLG